MRDACTVNLIECFGASKTMARQWEKNGFNTCAFDLLLSSNHDIVSESGFYTCVQMAPLEPWLFSVWNIR